MVAEHSIMKKTQKLPKSDSTLQDDLHNVINMMGPPTPMLPDTGREPLYEPMALNCTQSSSDKSASSNTSFVEVLIKNHHKPKPSRAIKEIFTCKSDYVNTAAQTDSAQTSHIQFEEYEESSSSEEVVQQVKKVHSEGIVTQPTMPQCPHAMCPHAVYASGGSYMQNSNLKFKNEYNNQKTAHFQEQSITQLKKADIKQYDEIDKEEIKKIKSKRVKKDVENDSIDYSELNECRRIVKKTELYYFDHGNAAYYHTTDSPPSILADYLAEKTENAATRFWAQIFGLANVGVSLVTSFILQLIRFILFSIVRPLTVGVIQLFSDYFLKPFLSVLFNAVIQPPLIFVFNIMTSLRDLCGPIAHAIGYFLREIAVVFRAFRIVEYSYKRPSIV